MSIETPYILSNNLAMKATITGQESADTRFKLSRMADGKRYTRWQSTDTVLKNLDFQISAAYQRPVTCLMIDKNHTLNNVPCKFYYSDNGSAYTQIDSFTPSSSAVIFRRFTGQTARGYYRLELGNSSELHRIYQIWFGEAWSIEQNPRAPLDPDREKYEFDDFETESGVNVRIDRFHKRILEFNLGNIHSAMYANIQKLWNDRKIYGGFAWVAFRPDTNPSDTLYMRLTNKERNFPYPGGVHREGTLTYEEVIG